MEISTILTADVLDIIFEGKNKSYGAYELRRSYQRRLMIALAVMLSLTLLLLGAYLYGNRNRSVQAKQVIIPDDVLLNEYKQEIPEPPPPPPPPPPPEPPRTQTIAFTDPKIVKDEDVKDDEKPPEMKDLEDVKIGTANIEGVKDEGIVAPPVDDAVGKGIVEIPKPRENKDSLFLKVEIESKYPGGPGAWERFLRKSLRYPQEAQDNEIQGTVMVQFIVDADGNVTSVEAISGPNELRDEAIRVIRKSGQWEPAIQSHRKVKSYKKQPITFAMSDQ